MAGFIMQVQSAILPFVCTLETGQHLYYLKRNYHPCRACPSASNKPYGGSLIPHSPFGDRMRAT